MDWILLMSDGLHDALGFSQKIHAGIPNEYNSLNRAAIRSTGPVSANITLTVEYPGEPRHISLIGTVLPLWGSTVFREVIRQGLPLEGTNRPAAEIQIVQQQTVIVLRDHCRYGGCLSH